MEGALKRWIPTIFHTLEARECKNQLFWIALTTGRFYQIWLLWRARSIRLNAFHFSLAMAPANHASARAMNQPNQTIVSAATISPSMRRFTWRICNLREVAITSAIFDLLLSTQLEPLLQMRFPMCLRLRLPLVEHAGIYPTVSKIDESNSFEQEN